MPEGTKAHLVVYTDGGCPFCQWSRRRVEQYDRERRVDFRDYNDTAVARETPFTDTELATEMHVVTPGGHWHGGFSAWLEVLNVLPRWRWLGKLFRLAPFRWAGPTLYRAIARNRYRAPNFVLRWTGAPPPCSLERGCPLPRSR